MTHGKSTGASGLDVLFIDNFDSFVFNLVDEFEKRGCNVAVWRNDISAEQALALTREMGPRKLVVLSPGPGAPKDAGCCIDLIKQAPHDLPIFGVCLGHQAIIEACNGRVVRAREIVHGKSSAIVHDAAGTLFESIASPLSVGRYHSLVTEPDESQFHIRGRCGDMVMAAEHKTRKLVSVQFHPESILTPGGGRLIENVINWA